MNTEKNRNEKNRNTKRSKCELVADALKYEENDLIFTSKRGN